MSFKEYLKEALKIQLDSGEIQQLNDEEEQEYITVKALGYSYGNLARIENQLKKHLKVATGSNKTKVSKLLAAISKTLPLYKDLYKELDSKYED